MNIKEKIIEQLEIKNTQALSVLLTESLTVHKMLNNRPLPSPATELKIGKFLKGIHLVFNDKAKQEKILSIITMIQIVFGEFDIELSQEEALVFYSLKDQGRFRVKDDKLYSQLCDEYGYIKDIQIDKSEFKDILKELKNVGLIDLRRGTVTLGERVMLH